MVCQAAQHKQAAKVAAAAASLPALLATHPALALVSTPHLKPLLLSSERVEGLVNPVSTPQVDDRLNGDGTGKILGIGSVEGWAILIVFALVWSLYYAAQTDLDKGKNSGDDGGLSL